MRFLLADDLAMTSASNVCVEIFVGDASSQPAWVTSTSPNRMELGCGDYEGTRSIVIHTFNSAELPLSAVGPFGSHMQ